MCVRDKLFQVEGNFVVDVWLLLNGSDIKILTASVSVHDLKRKPSDKSWSQIESILSYSNLSLRGWFFYHKDVIKESQGMKDSLERLVMNCSSDSSSIPFN
jgi:hypothetical protein